jgi:hypothetical protein
LFVLSLAKFMLAAYTGITNFMAGVVESWGRWIVVKALLALPVMAFVPREYQKK